MLARQSVFAGMVKRASCFRRLMACPWGNAAARFRREVARPYLLGVLWLLLAGRFLGLWRQGGGLAFRARVRCDGVTMVAAIRNPPDLQGRLACGRSKARLRLADNISD